MKDDAQFLLRRWRNTKGRVLRAIFGIAIGIAGFLAVLVTNATVNESFEKLSRELSGTVDASVEPAYPADSLPAKVLNELRGVPEVRTVDPVLGFFGSLSGPDHQPHEVIIFGKSLHPGDDILGVELAEGRVFQPREREVLLTETLAGILAVEIGDQVRIAHEGGLVNLEVVGLLYETREGRINRGRVAFVPLGLAQAFTGLGTSVRGASIYLEPGTETSPWVAEIRESFESVVITVPESFLPEPISQFQDVMLFYSVLALLLGGILVFVTLNVEIQEQLRSLALLHLLGARARQLRGVVYIQGLAQGVLAIPLGIALGVAAAKLNTTIVARLYRFVEPSTRLDIEFHSLALVVVVGVALPLLMGLLPAQRASRVDALTLFRSDNRPTRDPRYAYLIGFVFFTLALIIGSRAQLRLNTMLWLILPSLFISVMLLRSAFLTPLKVLGQSTGQLRLRGLARLGAASALRGSDRSSVSLAVLIIVVALAVATLSTRASMQAHFESLALASLPADLNIYGMGTTLPLDVEDDIEEVPGVRAVTALRFKTITLNPSRGNELLGLQTLIVDPDSFFQVVQPDLVEGTVQRAREGLKSTGLLIGEELLTPGLTIGDGVDMRGPEGPARGYAIVGIMRTTRSPISLIIGLNAASQHMRLSGPEMVSIRLEEDAEPSEVEAAIHDRFFGHTHIRIATATRQIEAARQLLYDYGVTLLGIVGMGLVAALLGLASSLEISVLQRLRDLRVMKILGATRKHLRSVVLWELSLLLSTALLFGIPLGTLVGVLGLRVMSARGLEMTFRFPIQDVLLACLAIVAVCLFAGRPALRQLARLQSLHLMDE